MTMSFTDRIRSLFSPIRQGSKFDSREPENKGFVISMCVLAAFILWFAFSMQETYTQIIDFQTEIRNLPSDKALSALPPSSIRIQVEGEGVQVLRLYYNPPVVPINAEAGEVDLLLVASEVVNNVSLQTVTPRTTQISIENRDYRKVPIVPVIELDFSPGFGMIGQVSISPDSITISGAASIISGITMWHTQKRQLGQLADSLFATIAISDSLEGLVGFDVSEVTVRANITEFTEATRTIEVRAIGLGETEQVSFVPSTVDVTYLIPLSQYDSSLAAEDFYVFVPYSDTRRDEQGLVYPMIHLPNGLAVREARIDPVGLKYYDIRND
jgi:hypothetical protein